MSEVDNPVIAMFRWWNAAYAADGFRAEGFARHFTPELEFTVNGAPRGRTCAELAQSFQRVKVATRHVRLVLPVIETFRMDDRVFVHYRVEAVTEAGEMLEEAMACATIVGGKIARMTIVNYERPAQL